MANHDDEFELESDRAPAERPTDPNLGRGETGSFQAVGWERPAAAPAPHAGQPAPAARRDEPTRGDSRVDDWFWWTDGEQSRPVHQVPPRPDLPPDPRVV